MRLLPDCVRDTFWVAKAYFLGKICRRKRYVPCEEHGMVFFNEGIFWGERRKKARLMKLMWLWGLELPQEADVAKYLVGIKDPIKRWHALFFHLRWKN